MKSFDINSAHHEEQPLYQSSDGLFEIAVSPTYASLFSGANRSEAAFKALQGVIFPPRGRHVLHRVVIGRLHDTSDLALELRSDELHRTASEIVVPPFLPETQTDEWADAIAVRSSWVDAARAIRADVPVANTTFWEAGAQCWPACGIISEYRSSGDHLWRLRTDMVAFVPVQRKAILTLCDREIVVDLLANGTVNNVQHRAWSFRNTPAGDTDLERNLWAFDHDSKRIPEGPCTMPAVSSIASELAKISDGLHRGGPRTGPSLVVVEDGIDLRDPSASQLVNAAPHQTFSDLLSDGSGITHASTCPARNVLHILNPDSDHGSKVVSALTRDLASGRVNLLDASEILRTTDASSLGRKWGAYLRQEQTRVVVLAQMHGIEVTATTCDKFFEEIFLGAPDALFILGAGNSGWRDVNSCAQGMTGRYRNVISVAGSDANGIKLERLSNRGRNTVDLAAPWASIQTRQGPFEPKRIFAGTSHAASWVANLAAKYWATLPDASVAEVKDALYASCSKQNLDVGCGGAVQADSFIALLRARRPPVENSR